MNNNLKQEIKQAILEASKQRDATRKALIEKDEREIKTIAESYVLNIPKLIINHCESTKIILESTWSNRYPIAVDEKCMIISSEGREIRIFDKIRKMCKELDLETIAIYEPDESAFKPGTYFLGIKVPEC